MPARAIGTASISFGLVSVPIKMFSAADTTAAIGFNRIHKDCGSRLKQKYICAQRRRRGRAGRHGEGLRVRQGPVRPLHARRAEGARGEGDNQIEIVEFVPEDKVEPVYLDKPYYLGPDKGGDRAYRLLAEAMRETGLSALGRYAARGKQYLVLLTPMQDGIVMQQLNYADEVRPFDEVPLPAGEVKKKELKLAIQLIQQIRDRRLPARAVQGRGARARARADRAEGRRAKTSREAPTEAPQTQIIDLMAALKASLDKGGSKARKPAHKAAKKEAAAPARSGGARKRKAAGS